MDSLNSNVYRLSWDWSCGCTSPHSLVEVAFRSNLSKPSHSRRHTMFSMRSLSVLSLLLAVPALAFQPQSLLSSQRAVSVRPSSDFQTHDHVSSRQRPHPSWSYDGCSATTTSTSLAAFVTDQPSNIFDGPLALTKERDACGVGFIANTCNDSSEFGTHKVLQQGLSALGCMEHRGACGGDGVSGDGAGIMTQIPWKLFEEFRSDKCPQPGVGMVFLPRNAERRNAVKEMIEEVCEANE